MDAAARRTIRFVAAQMVFVAAILHVGIGLVEWYGWFQVGYLYPGDDRWPAFVFSGLLIVAGMVRAAEAENLRPYYLAGIAAMAVYVLGYFLWHLTGHLPYLGATPSFEELTLQWIVDHATAGIEEFVALVAETVAIVLLAILYVDEVRAEADGRRADRSDTADPPDPGDGDSGERNSADGTPDEH